MSVSPLSGAMAQPAAPEKKKKKRGGALLLISGIALTASLSGVFATSTIAINGAADIEFGSGIESATACDASLTASISQSFSSGSFVVGNIVIGGIEQTCEDQTLSVILADSSNAPMCGIAGTDSSVTLDLTSGSATATAGQDKFVLNNIPAGGATITIPATSACATTNLAKVALATS